MAGLLVVGLADLFTLGLERLVGMRYLHRGRRSRGARLALVVGVALMVVGFGLFSLAHGQSRALGTAAVLGVLAGGLTAVVAFLLRTFSVFTTVSTMGVVLGVASLVVVLGVTSGFEREFQDKVLALNAHLIVMPYGDAEVDGPEIAEIETRLRGTAGRGPDGEVRVLGRRGDDWPCRRQPEGNRPREGGRRFAAVLYPRERRRAGAPASCPAAVGDAAHGADQVGADSPSAPSWLAASTSRVGDCVSIMVPFSAGVGEARTAYLFKVVGLFRMGFNEYDTRLAYVSIADAQRLANARRLVRGSSFVSPIR